MKSILIIGMGRFGKRLATKMVELKNEVMIIDQNEDVVAEMSSVVADAQIGDCTKESVLRAVGVRNFDMCVVAIGYNFQASLEITALLKELGAKYVVSKSDRDIQAKFLMRCGADEVINPEKDMAEKLAVRYSSNKIFDYFELTPEYSMFEIPVQDEWVGSTIREIAVRTRYHVSVLAIRKANDILPMPKSDYVFQADDHMIVFGKAQDVNRITAN